MSDKDRFVVKRDEGWAVVKPHAERASGLFSTKRDAVERAKEIVENLGGGEVRSQNRDGQWGNSDTVPNGNDPFPPRDKK